MALRQRSVLAIALLIGAISVSSLSAQQPFDSSPEEVDGYAISDEGVSDATAVNGPYADPSMGSQFNGPPPQFNFPIFLTAARAPSPFRFFGGALVLRPGADNLGWSVLTNELNYASPAPIASPFWNIQTLTPTYQPGFEIGGSYALADPTTDIQSNWQHLRTVTNSAVGTPQADGQWISPFAQTGPPTAASYPDLENNQGVNLLRSATAQVKFAYDSVNLDVGKYIAVGPALTFRLFAGLNYSRVQEKLLSAFFGVPPDPNATFPANVPLAISLNNTSTFWGIGPRFGVETTYRTPRGWRLTSQLAGAALVGQTQPAQYLFAATAPPLAAVGIPLNVEGIYSHSYTHVVGNLFARLGLGYNKPLANGSVLTFDGGWLATLYLNPFSGYATNTNILPLQIGSLATGSMAHWLSNFSATGFYLNAGLNF